jgi:hypothetical protein
VSTSLHAVFGLAAQALLVAWVVWQFAARAPSRQSRLFAAVGAALSLLPLADGVSAAMALRALWGDPSITTLQLLALTLAGRPANIGRAPAAALAIFGIVFYALALGVGDFDPYRIGYAAGPLVVVLGGAAASAWWRGQPLYLWLLAVDLAAYAVGLLESTNLWDHLFDPLLVAAAIVVAIRRR